jgi:hypothetical protein
VQCHQSVAGIFFMGLWSFRHTRKGIGTGSEPGWHQAKRPTLPNELDSFNIAQAGRNWAGGYSSKDRV